MAKAYKCDKCGKFHDGNANMSVGLDERSEIIFRHTLGLKFFPGSEAFPVHLKDLCNDCAKAFCDWWREE